VPGEQATHPRITGLTCQPARTAADLVGRSSIACSLQARSDLDDLHRASGRKHEVRWLDIAVHDADRMRGRQRGGCLPGIPQRQRNRQRSA
jgi:hypothetical protein